MPEEKNIPRNTGVEEDVSTEGDEGKRSAEATPEIADDAKKEQTTVPAPADDASKSEGMPAEEAQDPRP